MAENSAVATRDQIALEHKWDLESVYADDKLWEQEFATLAPLFQELEGFKGRLGESAATLLAALTLREQITDVVVRLAQYGNARADENNTNSAYSALRDRGRQQYARFSEAAAFIQPEILALPREQIDGFIAAEAGLQVYQHYFDDLYRSAAHVLSPREEALLAGAADMASMPAEIHSMLNYADMRFGVILDEDGQEVELTHGRYQRLRQSQDRRVRKDAFFKRWTVYGQYKQTLAATFAANAKKSSFYARARNYASSQEKELSEDNIPLSVYSTLIDTVHGGFDHLQRYLELRRRLLGLDELHMYDLYVPLVKSSTREIPYQQAVEMVLAAFAPMGEEYVAVARKGLSERWVDVYETAGKTAGAYSSGSYRSKPFILLNYQNTLNDVYTLAHEMGHSMHTYFAHRKQPILYAGYTLFVAEVASTLNELLLSHYLLNNSDDPSIRAAVINENLDSARTTLYRQTQAAEFELLAHTAAEAGESLTPDLLNGIWLDLNRKYYAPAVKVDEDIAVEWAAFPHFYSDFYVYKYATGLSASTALARGIIDEGQPAVDRYLRFLGNGSSNYSINLLREAGVDMTSPQPVQATLDQFARYLDQMEGMVKQGAGV